MNSPQTLIAGRRLGSGLPALLIAEIGLNHNGDAALALAILRAAHEAGADAVKFQTFLAERLVSSRPDGGGAHAATADPVEFFRAYELPQAAYPLLMSLSCELGILMTSTPFDEESADMLAKLGVPFLKIASGDLTHIPLLAHVGKLNLPIVLSTGMGTMDEVEKALNAIGHRHVILLQCTSSYPCAAGDVDVHAMVAMRERFDLPVGLSDHTEGIGAAVAAVTLGACMIEKHFTSDQNLPGPDQKMSADPSMWRAMTKAIREAEAALGSAEKKPRACEETTIRLARRSLVAAIDLPAGHMLVRSDLAVKRPGTGLAPGLLEQVIGRRLARPVLRDAILGAEDLEL